jgi:hypothetical protein
MEVRENIQRIFCLPYLPSEHIQPMFNKIRSEGKPELEPLYKYIQKNWMEGAYWNPSAWSVFNMTIRTNNDAEGLHNLWNRRAQAKMTQFLYDEASAIPQQITMVAHDKLHREQRISTKRKDEFLKSISNSFTSNQITIDEMFKDIVHELKFPCVKRWEDNLTYDRYLTDE